jgi:hypothetical protein
MASHLTQHKHKTQTQNTNTNTKHKQRGKAKPVLAMALNRKHERTHTHTHVRNQQSSCLLIATPSSFLVASLLSTSLMSLMSLLVIIDNITDHCFTLNSNEHGDF